VESRKEASGHSGKPLKRFSSVGLWEHTPMNGGVNEIMDPRVRPKAGRFGLPKPAILASERGPEKTYEDG
jgi:hypothetical protein